MVSSLLQDITRLQFISKRYSNVDHHKFCIDKIGRDSGPEEDEQSNNEESEEENQLRALQFETKLKQYIIPELQTAKHRERFELMN